MRFGLNLAPQIRLYGAFFIYALALGAIYPRLGDLQLAMGIGESALGAALIGPGLGTFISLTFASAALERIGHRQTLIAGIILLSLAMSIASFSSGPLMLFVMLFFAGLMIGAVEVVINVEADRVEHQIGKRIMNRCHAFWSFGFFGAGMVGAFAKQFSVSPQTHLVWMTALTALLVPLFLSRMTVAPARLDVQTQNASRYAMPSLGILALVAFTLSAMFLEGATIDWSVIFMRDSFTAAPFVNGLAFAFGALSQAIMRFFADGLIEKFGTRFMARFFVIALGVGVIVVVTSPLPIIAIIGFGLIGVGASAMFPLAMSAAAQRSDRPAAMNVAALAQLSFVAFLVGPPLLGFVAEHFGVRFSFGICLPLVVVSWFAIRAVGASKGAASNV